MSNKSHSSNTGNIVCEMPQTLKRSPQASLPPWKVILHNDDINTAEFVVEKVREILHLEEEDAVLKVLEAHETGCSLLVVTHQEKAELLVEQFATYKITTTAEKN